jgi:KDO2-lipid IV(A) lauroyltransferase
MTEKRRPTLAELRESGIAAALRHLPVVWTSAIGGYLGALEGRRGIKAGRVWVQRLHRNIERFSGVADPEERKRHIVAHTRRIGRIYAEYTVLQRLVAEGRVEVVGREHLEGLSRPAIVASCHLANWELVGSALSLIPGSATALYAPPDNPVRHRLALAARTAWPRRTECELVAASPSAMRQLVKALTGGHNLLIFIDEERDGYVWSPSLGRRLEYAGNRWLTARLAVRYSADVIPVHVEATGNARYRVVIAPKLAAGEGNDETRARSLADQLDARFDAYIRANPEQWYWLARYEHDQPVPGVATLI